MTIEGIKERLSLFNQYDQMMEKLMKEMNEFRVVSRIVIGEKKEAIKLYGYAFNFAWTLYNSIDICQKYEAEIKNSLFHGRYEENQKYLDDFEIASRELIPFVENIVTNQCIEFEDYEGEGLITGVFDKEKLLSDNKYLACLKRHLSRNGYKILNIVCFYLRYMAQMLTSIKNFRANMSDNDYRFLFEREFDEYCSTEEWSDLESSFIIRTVNRRYHGVEPTQDQLAELLSEEYDKIEEMSDVFGIIEPYLEYNDKLARVIIKHQFKTEINSPILELFRHLGRIKLIVKWQHQLEEERLCYEPLAEEEVEFEYGDKYTKAVSKRTFPKILGLFENRNTKDWVCFYHVLVCYNYIECIDFNAFNRWLTELAGEVLISASYARAIKMEYWAEKAKYVWQLEEALKYKNSKQQEHKYKDYIILCDQIREIIDKG